MYIRKDDTMKHLKTNHEAMHMLTDRAREYLVYMRATLKGASDELYVCYPNGKKEWVRDIDFANKYLSSKNPYVVFVADTEDSDQLAEFDSLDRLKEWCYLQKAASIASGKEPLVYYYNYCYSVEEGGDLI